MFMHGLAVLYLDILAGHVMRVKERHLIREKSYGYISKY